MFSFMTVHSVKAWVGAACVLGCCVAHANASLCKGRGFIDSVYQNGLGGTDYEYMVIVRNQTSTPMTLKLDFRGFPGTVTLFSPTLPGIKLTPFGNQTIRFGRGTNGNISAGTVAVLYDGEVAAGRPAVVMSQCVSG